MQARNFLRNGCEAFLALVLDSKRGQVNLEDIPMIKEFLDVFPEELPGLPLEREVDMSIEVAHGTTLISRAPYHMSPIELKELKTQLQGIQLQELLNKGFVVFHRGVRQFCLLKKKMTLFECALIIDK